MNTGLIASRYAKALFEFATDRQAEVQVYDEITNLVKSFSLNSKLKVALNNPMLDNNAKKQLLIAATGGHIEPVFERFIDLILRNQRESYLQNIGLKYIDLYFESRNFANVRLTTALPLDREVEEKLVSSIKTLIHKDVIFERNIDSRIIGGLILQIGDLRWDGSIASQLKKIRKEIIQGQTFRLN